MTTSLCLQRSCLPCTSSRTPSGDCLMGHMRLLLQRHLCRSLENQDPWHLSVFMRMRGLSHERDNLRTLTEQWMSTSPWDTLRQSLSVVGSTCPMCDLPHARVIRCHQKEDQLGDSMLLERAKEAHTSITVTRNCSVIKSY